MKKAINAASKVIELKILALSLVVLDFGSIDMYNSFLDWEMVIWVLSRFSEKKTSEVMSLEFQ